jgi:hypothetical protein
MKEKLKHEREGQRDMKRNHEMRNRLTGQVA